MRTPRSFSQSLESGFQAIRLANGIQTDPVRAAQLAELAGAQAIDTSQERRDATDLPMVTLDPVSSTDLDQAFFVQAQSDENILLFYAIADIGAFVPRGSRLEAAAWEQGVTVYSPDTSVPLYPRVLSSQRASLLPDGPRPAVLLTVVVRPDGDVSLRHVERAWVRSRAKLAYDSVRSSDLPAGTLELARRIELAERARGAFRVERQEQEVISDDRCTGGWNLRYADRAASEDYNASLSLATNLAVAKHFKAIGFGLFRIMDEPDGFELASLREQARMLGIPWAANESLKELAGRLNQANPADAAMALAMRRTGGGARYALYDQLQGQREPWHAAIAAAYAHATAPMRRLADRYVLDLLVAQFSGDLERALELQAVLAGLPAVMESAEKRAGKIDRESIELVEAHILHRLSGKILQGRVMDVSREQMLVHLQSPAITWRVKSVQSPAPPLGSVVSLRVVATSDWRGVDLEHEVAQ